MARTRKEITDAELAVLKVLWETESATIREIADAVYPEGTAAHYATVQKLLERLEAKGLVDRDRSRHVHLFAARARRADLVGLGLEALAERLCDGAMGPLLTHLVGTKKLSREDRAELRKILDEPKSKGKARREKR